ncbi:amino acid ABC transporter permease [Actinoallomurus purpureus]|uniref:amino acid ABC transporter permease n=1 Tax=Actinoallomurus purpureus TaxID=478114 RepID=UPI0020920295|nr:amino acid ABC transporter permease [Actinoallomurus purpureus]MCO6006386.1 amino acid ABC transporter permease [Actinoallomurus purpureus]
MNWDVLLDFSPLADNGDKLLTAFWATIRISLTVAVLSLLIGTLITAMRVSPIRVLRIAGGFYVNTLRNTPLTLVLLFCSLGLSDTLKFKISGTSTVNFFWLAVIGMSFYTAAFIAESLRAGINTVPMGQAEAARAIGLTFTQSLRMVIMPQAFRAVVAPLGSVMIAMIKNTTVVLVASYYEAASLMKDMFEQYGATLPIFIGFAVGFMCLTLPTGFFFGWLAKRMQVAR